MSSSQSYASRLSAYSNKGNLNLTPTPDPPLATLSKIRHLAHLIRTCAPVVLHTGAGLSTAAGIRDFRGPDGVWTKQAGLSTEGTRGDGGAVSSFEEAVPTLAHMVITAMYHADLVGFVVSQNVDGLHRRAGLPREGLAELHGSLFVDWCSTCEKEYERETEASSVGFRKVGRLCEFCKGELTDKALDWEDELPVKDLNTARRLSKEASLNIVVGSSCQMEPARGLAFKGGKTVIVNLSETEYDARCWMTIREKADVVFAGLAHDLGLTVGRFRRVRELVLNRKGHGIRMMVVMDGHEEEKIIGGVEDVRYLVDNEVSTFGEGAGYGAKVGLGKVVAYVQTETGTEIFDIQTGGTVRKEIVTQERDYMKTMRELVRQLEFSARTLNTRKRKQADEIEWEPRKWFIRSDKRGWCEKKLNRFETVIYSAEMTSGPTLDPVCSLNVLWDPSQIGNLPDCQQRQMGTFLTLLRGKTSFISYLESAFKGVADFAGASAHIFGRREERDGLDLALKMAGVEVTKAMVAAEWLLRYSRCGIVVASRMARSVRKKTSQRYRVKIPVYLVNETSKAEMRG